MAKNQVQFQKSYSLVGLLSDYGTEEQCEKALYNGNGLKGLSVHPAALGRAAKLKPGDCTNVNTVTIKHR